MKLHFDDDTDDAFWAWEVGYAVLAEAKENPTVFAWLNALMNRHVTDASDRARFELPPLPVADVLDFTRPGETT